MKRRTHLAPRLPTLLAWLSLMLAPACSCRQTNEVAPLPPKAEGPALAGLQGPPPSVAGVPAGLLLPPATPGDSRVAITGCLAEADEVAIDPCGLAKIAIVADKASKVAVILPIDSRPAPCARDRRARANLRPPIS